MSGADLLAAESAVAAVAPRTAPSLVAAALPATLAQAADDADAFVAAVRPGVLARIGGKGGRADRALADREQHLVHGFAWYATYARTLCAVAAWVAKLDAAGELRPVDALLAQLLFGDYCAQLAGGIAMSQSEIVRPRDLTEDASILALLDTEALRVVWRDGCNQDVRTAIARHLAEAQGSATLENCALGETHDLIREQFFGFAQKKIAPFAHQWHTDDTLIPLSVIEDLGALGVFGLTIPEEHGGLGMGKAAMCVVGEELSRGWIGVGSLATRSEIAAELILYGGTAAQKAHWLPLLASGEILPTAVFTEPDAGSDLGSLRTRAILADGEYRVSGSKTWITHAARADVMTVLVRTDPATSDYSGLSMLIAPKQRGTDADPFPTPGMKGGEIKVLGYRGMKEYEIGFDDFRVSAEGLLGGVEGQGFRQLMATFESARIQTAARAIGVAQAALDAGLNYALQRRQFGRSILEFPRIANKLAMMAAEIMGARQLTYVAAARKDEGKRCDVEAGMAKLLAARVAWAAADSALQVHGGNGFACEYEVSRLLADARILNIFEGAGEIQAQVIGRRLLDQAN